MKKLSEPQQSVIDDMAKGDELIGSIGLRRHRWRTVGGGGFSSGMSSATFRVLRDRKLISYRQDGREMIYSLTKAGRAAANIGGAQA